MRRIFRPILAVVVLILAGLAHAEGEHDHGPHMKFSPVMVQTDKN